VLDNYALELLAEERIHIFEVGKVFSIAYDNPRANPKFFYETAERFRFFINGLDTSVSMLTSFFENSADLFSDSLLLDKFFESSKSTNSKLDEQIEVLGNIQKGTTKLSELVNQTDIEVELMPDTDMTNMTNNKVNNLSNNINNNQ